MDEVEFINMDDLNDLEARLYAQIHHESTEPKCDTSGTSYTFENPVPIPAFVRTVTATRVVNTVGGNKSGRYWNDSKSQNQSINFRTKYPLQNQDNESEQQFSARATNASESSTQNTSVENYSSIPKVTGASPDPSKKSQTEQRTETSKTEINSGRNTSETHSAEQPTSSFQAPKPKTSASKLSTPITKHDVQNSEKYKGQNQSINNKTNKNLRVNPVASWMDPKTKSIKNHRNERQNKELPPPPPNTLKNGPFSKQFQKLNKAMRLEAKKQKSKAVKSKKKSPKILQTIVLESSEESDVDDVIVVALPPPPTYTIDDSDEDTSKLNQIKEKSETNVLVLEENAQDATDVDMEKTAFVKPLSSSQQNSSRCTSPCSVLSSDDFIGQNDRSRLLKGTGIADDEDLLMLTADVDSLMELPKNVTQDDQNNSEKREIQMEKDSSDDVECTTMLFVQPSSTSTSKNNYRVEQTQFRALDVYESESDITDSFYARGNRKETIIRTVGSSSDDDQENTDIGQKTKRLRKRRASGSNKESETNNEGSSSSEADEWGIIDATAVPFIARGPAVENYITKVRNDSQSSNSQRVCGGSNVQMSDNEFIATLNTLVQGGNDEELANVDDESSHSGLEISARDIAEEVLTGGKTCATRTTAGSVIEDSISDSDQITENTSSQNILTTPGSLSAAVPNEALTNLDKVFETIDTLGKRNRNRGDVVNISDDSEDEQNAESHMTFVQQQVISKSRKRKNIIDEVVDPVYNVIYSEGNHFSGGLGWSDEMRRFYNNSWNGEHFNLKAVWSKMDPNRNLWKIYTEDRFPKSRRFMNLKCHNCCEFGHIRAKCTRPKKPLICYMCGQQGHYEPRCPNTICLRCGNKTHVFTKSCNACTFQNRLICPVCKVRGHTLNLCPDKWRRYHSTTKPNAYPNNKVEYKSKKCCCICGGRGHLSETCKSAVRFLEYPVYVSEIKSHQKSYNDQSMKSLETGIGFNLLYRPDDDVRFDLAENTTSKDYYGRFLNAVGMGYLLKRKRKSNILSSNAAKKGKKNHETYVPNPYSKAGQEARNEPEQVQEISESGSVERFATEENAIPRDEGDENSVVVSEIEENEVPSNALQTKQTEIGNQFKTPVIIEANTQAEIVRESEPFGIDSDSNYSFSEHFETPSSATTTSDKQTTKPREMDPLPDFIPLNDAESSGDSDVDHQAGISKKYITANTDDEEDSSRKSPLPDIPCEAKIYLTHFHSKYLLSPDGHKFLVEKSKECNIKARLDWTSVGHVLIIFGLQENQDKFHRELLLKYRHLSDQMNRKRVESSQKVPRRADVLIRFLRENIAQLMTNLGNANELFKRLKFLENHQQSKSEWKSAEKARRSLNMILIGQAGLSDGSLHLDKLLLSLKKLINEYKGDDNASNELRDEIDNHWRVIFTSYRHDNYPELVDMYNKLITKNRIPKLNIDPILLGINKVIDTSLTKEQRERMEMPVNQKNITTPEKRQRQSSKDSQGKQHLTVVPNPLNSKNLKSVQKSSQATLKTNESISQHSTSSPSVTMKSNNKDTQSVNVTSSKLKNNNNIQIVSKKVRLSPPPFANPQQKSNTAAKITEVTRKWETTCDSLLNEIDAPTPAKGPVRDCKAPSMFWSRECLKFLKDSIKVVKTNVPLAEKLQRVQTKAQSGSLSYNDYRAVIKLHKAILGK